MQLKLLNMKFNFDISILFQSRFQPFSQTIYNCGLKNFLSDFDRQTRKSTFINLLSKLNKVHTETNPHKIINSVSFNFEDTTETMMAHQFFFSFRSS